MCSSPGNANKAPQFAGTTELEQGRPQAGIWGAVQGRADENVALAHFALGVAGSFPALFLLLAVLGAAMAGAALASLFNRLDPCDCPGDCVTRQPEGCR
jgi:hypothetical protein